MWNSRQQSHEYYATFRLPNDILSTCDYLSREYHTDKGFVLAAMISTIAVTMRGVCVVLVGQHRKERIAMCTVLNAAPGVGKGRALKAPQEFLKRFENKIQDQASKCGEGMNDMNLPILTMSGCSPQMMLEVLASQSGFISIIDEEMGTMRGLIQREDLRDWTLKMLEGGTIEKFTRKDGHMRIDIAQAVILTASQPPILEKLVKRYALDATGFFSRVFTIVPGQFSFLSDSSVTIAAYHDFEARLARILDKTSTGDGRKRETEIQITLSPQAESMLKRFQDEDRNDWDEPLVSTEGLNMMKSWRARSSGHALKIAAILLAYRDQLSTTEIDEETLHFAINVTLWLEACAFASCCGLFPAPGLAEAKVLVPALRNAHGSISKAALHEWAARELRGPRIEQGISFLLHINAISLDINIPYSRKGGRPQKRYLVNYGVLNHNFPLYDPLRSEISNSPQP